MSFEPFWATLEAKGTATALIADTGEQISYSDLAARADHWQAELAQLWSNADQPALVALEITPTIDMIAAYLGALRAGHAVLLTDCTAMQPGQPISEIYRPNLHLSLSGGTVQATLRDPEVVTLHDDLAVLLSTSGTTGAPKLVRLSADNVASNAASIADYLGLSSQERAITTLPLYYSYGMSVLHAHLSAGASLILTERSITQPDFWDLFRSAKATSMALVPHQFDLLDSIKFSEMKLPSLRYITQAGGKLPRSSVTRFAGLGETKGWQLYIMYGQTEAGPRMAYVPPDQLLTHCDVIGQAIPGGRLWVADEDGTPIEVPNQPGELFYQGPNVMMGYAESREELGGPQGSDILPTGDIALRTDAGFFSIVGRKKRFVKLFGLRLGLDELDQSLDGAGLKGFALSADDRLVVLHEDEGAGPAITAHLAETYSLPMDAILTAPLDEVPLLSSGKIDYRGLQALASEAASADEAKRAGAAENMRLRDVIGRVTRTSQVKDSDTFMDLGGDSLGYLQVTMTLERQLNHIPEGWEQMSVAELERVKPLKEGMGTLSSDVLARVIGVSLIVANHIVGNWPIGGGTWALLMIFGFSFARFNRGAITKGTQGITVLKMLYPILPLYYGMLILVLLAGHWVEPTMFTLTTNYTQYGGSGFLVSPNWFVSTYVQLLIGLVALLSVPFVTRHMVKTPWLLGMVGLGIALGVSLLYQWSVWDVVEAATERRDWTYILRTPLTCAAPVIMGWCIYTANTPRERLITAFFVIANAWVFPGGTLTHFIVLAGIGLLLLSRWSISVPKIISAVMRAAAGTALFVYLLHAVPVHVFTYETNWREALGPVLSILVVVPLSFLLAWTVQKAFDFFDGIALKLWGHIRAKGLI